MMVALAVLVALAMAVTAVPTLAAAQGDGYVVEFEGPGIMVPGGKASLTVNVISGPDGTIKYEVKVPSGASATPKSKTTSSRSFTTNITAPSEIGKFTVTFELSSQDGSVKTPVQYDVEVVEPVTLSVELKNSANVAADGVPVDFYVDGEHVGTVKANIPANDTRVVTYDWTGPVGGLSSGRHSLEVIIDPDEQFIDFIDGSKTFNTHFYAGDGGWGLPNIMLGVLLVVFTVLVVLTYVNRGKKKRKKRR